MNQDIIVAFVGKQDPMRHDGRSFGPLLSAVDALPFKPVAALLLYAEGGSDRADDRDDRLAQGTQALRAEDVADQLRQRFEGIACQLVELSGANVSYAQELLDSLRRNTDVRGFRQRWSSQATANLLIAGGTPAMRELLSALHVNGYFGPTRGWYTPDREALRQETPLVAQTVVLAGVASALQLGEYALAYKQLREVQHPDASSAETLLKALLAYQDGDYLRAASLLRAWPVPSDLERWRADALTALKHFATAQGELMVYWNETQSSSVRTALLAYSTLVESALHALHQQAKLRLINNSAEGMVNDLRQRQVMVPDALDAGAGLPKQLYKRRNKVIHHGDIARADELAQIHQAATDLLRAYPDPPGELAHFLSAPHRNPFSPQRRADLAATVRDWLLT